MRLPVYGEKITVYLTFILNVALTMTVQQSMACTRGARLESLVKLRDASRRKVCEITHDAVPPASA